jgi:hydroxypyruvate reductase
MSARENAIQIFNTAVAAVQPKKLIADHLFIDEFQQLHILGQSFGIDEIQKIYLVGSGKASAAMAKVVQDILGDLITAGLVVTKYGHSISLEKIICLEAAHPVPDLQGIEATKATIQLLKQVNKNDLVICLVSGGASALWVDVPTGLTLADIQLTFQLLLNSGASIDEVNTIRKHLSVVKGGQLLQYAPDAHWFSFIISDVPEDDLTVIASGPTVPDNSTFDDCLLIIDKYNLADKLPSSVYQRMEDGDKGIIQDTFKKQHPVFERVINQIIGNNLIALKAAESKAIQLGYHISKVETSLTGDAEQVGLSLIDFCNSYQGVKPACILLGGETTVKVTGKGIGGRNQHMALSALQELAFVNQNNFSNKITFLSAGTDGTDGPTDAAGAVVDRDTIAKANDLKLDIANYLLNNDSYTFFDQSGGLLKIGATHTNVMDLVVILID